MKTLILLPILFLLLFACDSRPVNFEGGDPARHDLAQEYEVSKAPVPTQTVANKQSVGVSDRKLIKTGRLSLEVKDVAGTRIEIEKIGREYDAYISSETQSYYTSRVECTQVVRIPSQKFDAFVKAIEGLDVDIKDRNIETSDVTEEFIDTEARIKTKKELENRYREILKQAKEVSDMLSIEAQLNHVRSDIEAMDGRLTYLKNQVAYSTLTLTFYESNGTDSAFGSKTLAAFSNGWDMLLAFLLGLLNIWPFILLTAGVCYIAVRKSRGRRNRASDITQ